MIFLRISSENKAAIEQVAEELIKNRFVIDLNFKSNIERWYEEHGTIQKKTVTLVTAKTKGLLFGKIDELIREMFPEFLFEIYSVPIVHMDWNETKHLQSEVVDV